MFRYLRFQMHSSFMHTWYELVEGLSNISKCLFTITVPYNTIMYSPISFDYMLAFKYFDCYGNYMVTKNDQIFSVTSFIVEKQLKRIVIDVFLDLMRHLLREIEITCNRGLSGFHWK